MNIVYKRPHELTPYERNTKKHDQKQIDNVAESIRQFGFVQPIVIDKDGVVVIGHCRLAAAKQLGLKEVPCLYVDTLTDEQVKALRIADNKTNESEWDIDMLRLELPEIDFFGFDFDFGLTEEEPEIIEDEPPEPDEESEPISKPGDIWELGYHRLMCGDSTDPEQVSRLMDGATADLIITDPPYNVEYEGKTKDRLTIQNDAKEDADFYDFLCRAFKTMNNHLKPGGAFYIWHADSEGLNFRKAAKNAGWTVRQCLIWNKNVMVMGRQDYQWKHEPCQPAGTMVLTTEGPKPIETLTDNDRVVSFDTYSGQVKGYRNGGYEIRTASRDYDGLMYSIRVGKRTTRATDNHQFSVRFNADSRKNYCTYLMRRGNWWRVGIAKAYDARQFGLKTRIHQERGDEAWIISMHADKTEAQVMEQILTCRYGIPYTVWETTATQRRMKRDDEQVRRIYDALDLEQMRNNAHRMLADFGRNPRHPLIDRESSAARYSTRTTIRVHACNLIPELMQVPVPAAPAASPNFRWQDITEVTFKQERCRVYSLSVDRYEHYVSDGIVTHNCLYGWKDGAGHYFIDDRTQTTVYEDKGIDLKKLKKQEMLELLKDIFADKVSTTIINEDRPSRSAEHPTMKPVKLIARLALNSSRLGEIVLDTFGGSGSTMIACEQLGRTAYTMELDPKYCDVIIKRYEKFTGRKAIRKENINEQN